MAKLRREPTEAAKQAKSPGSSNRKLPGQGKLPAKIAKQAEDVDCPSRGPHDKQCLCKGTGQIKAIP